MPEKFGEKFLHQTDSKLHTSQQVERAKERKGLKSQKPEDKIAAYLERFKDVLNPKPLEGHPQFDRKERNISLLKKGLHDSVIIKPEDIPETYFDNQRRLAREQGHGDIEITKEARQQAAEVIIADQKSTLDNWIDYLTSPDSDSYPMWAKYWAFKGMLKLSSYDKEKHAFSKRDKNTVAPFPDLNREALAYVVDAIIKKVNKENIPVDQNNPEFQQLLQGANFGKLYAWAIEKVTPTEQAELLKTDGEWVKYDRESDHMPLVKSLQGHGTGWCTAGEDTAEHQLRAGDFHVYYSYDKQGKPTIPRIAIRMQGQEEIAEVRGIAPEQNLDPQVSKTEILETKLKEFGSEGERYQQRTADMKRLTEIDRKHKEQQELSKDDLKFLYGVESTIEGFGYRKDPRIQEIQEQRDIKKDLAFVFDCSENEISLTREEALKGGIKYHHDDLVLGSLTSAQGLELPEKVKGGIYLNSLTSAEGLKPPKEVGGDIILSSLTSAQGLELPEKVGGSILLRNLASAQGLKLPKEVGGDIYLNSLTSAEGLELPKEVGGYIDLRNLTSAQGLRFPEKIGGGIYLDSLTSAQDLRFPKEVGGDICLSSLTSAQGVKFPEKVGGDIDLHNLTSAQGLELPKEVGGYIDLSSLTLAERNKLQEQHLNLRITGGIILSRRA